VSSINRVPCLNTEAHGVTSHIAGSAAAIACQQTGGRSTKMAHIVKPPRLVHKGNNIGNVSVLTNIDPEALAWSAKNITRQTPRDVASLIEVASSNAFLRENYRDFVRPFVTLIHDDDYADEFGENSLLPNPNDLGFSYSEPNEQAQKIIDQPSAPGFSRFVEALASEMDSDAEAVTSAYTVITGYLSNEDYAKVYAVGCLRAEYLDLAEQKTAIDKQQKELAAIFNEEVDDGVVTTKHGVGFADGEGVQFTPKRTFNYDNAAPLPIAENLSDEEKAAIAEDNKDRLTPEKYKSIIKSWDPKYHTMAEIEKILSKEDFEAFVTYGSTALSVK